MPEQDSPREVKRDSLIEAYTPTGKHEFNISSGMIFIGDPYTASSKYIKDPSMLNDFLYDIEESTIQKNLEGRIAFLSQGAWVYDQAQDSFEVHLSGGAIRLTNDDMEDNPEADESSLNSPDQESDDFPKSLVVSDHNNYLIGDPKSFGIKKLDADSVDGKFIKVPNGRYTVKVAALEEDEYMLRIKEIEIKRLGEGELAPSSVFEISK